MKSESETNLGWDTVKENLSGFDKLRLILGSPVIIVAYALSFVNDFGIQTMSATRNWWDVFLVMTGIENESMIFLNDGTEFMLSKPLFGKLRSKIELANFKRYRPNIRISARNGKVLIPIGSKTITVDQDYAAQIATEFHTSHYDGLEVRRRTVVDIGGYVGDTAMFFVAKQGASHVYSYEPFTTIYEVAKREVSANGLSSRITMLNAAVAGARGQTTVNDKTTNFSAVRTPGKRGSGKNIPIFTLDDVVRKLKIKGGALKVDCEGAEYGIFRNASSEAIRSFDTIYVEYHYGYKTVVDRLEKEGYRVTHTTPVYQFHPFSGKSIMAMGSITARKKR